MRVFFLLGDRIPAEEQEEDPHPTLSHEEWERAHGIVARKRPKYSHSVSSEPIAWYSVTRLVRSASWTAIALCRAA
jgi:hypothetical protein